MNTQLAAGDKRQARNDKGSQANRPADRQMHLSCVNTCILAGAQQPKAITTRRQIQ